MKALTKFFAVTSLVVSLSFSQLANAQEYRQVGEYHVSGLKGPWPSQETSEKVLEGKSFIRTLSEDEFDHTRIDSYLIPFVIIDPDAEDEKDRVSEIYTYSRKNLLEGDPDREQAPYTIPIENKLTVEVLKMHYHRWLAKKMEPQKLLEDVEEAVARHNEECPPEEQIEIDTTPTGRVVRKMTGKIVDPNDESITIFDTGEYVEILKDKTSPTTWQVWVQKVNLYGEPQGEEILWGYEGLLSASEDVYDALENFPKREVATEEETPDSEHESTEEVVEGLAPEFADVPFVPELLDDLRKPANPSQPAILPMIMVMENLENLQDELLDIKNVRVVLPNPILGVQEYNNKESEHRIELGTYIELLPDFQKPDGPMPFRILNRLGTHDIHDQTIYQYSENLLLGKNGHPEYTVPARFNYDLLVPARDPDKVEPKKTLKELYGPVNDENCYLFCTIAPEATEFFSLDPSKNPKLFSREDNGLTAPRNPPTYSTMKSPTTITGHHLPFALTEGLTPGDLQRIHKGRKTSKGEYWSDLGYHYLIYPDGSVHVGRTRDFNEKLKKYVHSQGAHAGFGNNEGNIGIAYAGNLDNHPPTWEQIKAFGQLTNALIIQNPTIKEIKTHGQTWRCHNKDRKVNCTVDCFKATDCPGIYGTRICAYYNYRFCGNKMEPPKSSGLTN